VSTQCASMLYTSLESALCRLNNYSHLNNLINSRCKYETTNEQEVLSPCVAVIDEDTEWASDNRQAWVKFRAEYPNRPFCLLIPYRTDVATVFIPTEALTDPNFQVFTVPRGDATADWFSLCGLDKMKSSEVQSIGLFMDGSNPNGDKYPFTDSYKKFLTDAAKANMKVCEVYDASKEWIGYFMNTLSPNMLSCIGPEPIIYYTCLSEDDCTCDDYDKCTLDVLDSTSGTCSNNPISCPDSQSCDPVDG
jgi:hypothetical protein